MVLAHREPLYVCVLGRIILIGAEIDDLKAEIVLLKGILGG